MALIKREKPQRLIEERQGRRDRESLLAQLNSESDFERRMAARDLAEHAGVSDALCQRLEIEAEASARAALFSSLTQIGDQEAVTGLIALLRSEDAGLRNGSVTALQSLPDQVAARIETLLQDADPDVRIFTINILEELSHPFVPRWLREVIETENQVNVCAAAVDLLVELGTPDMIPALLALKGRFADTPYIAFAVDLTVEHISMARDIELPV